MSLSSACPSTRFSLVRTVWNRAGAYQHRLVLDSNVSVKASHDNEEIPFGKGVLPEKAFCRVFNSPNI
jgi:hypothetical protein